MSAADTRKVRILFQTVGTGGPDNPVWKALAFTIQELRPNIVVHFCSQKTADETLPKVEELLKEYLSQFSHHIDINDDYENLDELTRAYDKRMKDARREHPDAEFHVDFTSGTKVMSAALVAAGIAHDASHFHYARGQRDTSGRAFRTECLVSLQGDQLIARHRLDEAGLLFNRGQFEAARRIARQTRPALTDEILKARAHSLEFLAEVCDSWQRFDWKKARQALKDWNRPKHKQPLEAAEWDLGHIEEIHEYLHRCTQKDDRPPATVERLVDLLANAERCLNGARYDDAVARLYRLVEYITQTRLAEKGMTTRKVPLENIEKVAPKWTDRTRRNMNGKEKNLGLRDQIEILEEMGDEVGRYLARRYFGDEIERRQPKGPLNNALQSRNDSLLAHGSKPINGETARKLYDEVEKALTQHMEHDRLERLLKIARFPQCPWAPDEPLPELCIDSAIT